MRDMKIYSPSSTSVYFTLVTTRAEFRQDLKEKPDMMKSWAPSSSSLFPLFFGCLPILPERTRPTAPLLFNFS